MPHFPPRAKHVIYLFQNGAPDPRRALRLQAGPEADARQAGAGVLLRRQTVQHHDGQPDGKLLLGPIEPFQQHGQSGAWVSEFLPHTAAVADDLCFIKSMHTDAINHAPAISLLLSGGQIPGRPTAGAWLAYGLGTETDQLPAFVVMTSVSKGTTCGQIFYDFYWGSGFLPRACRA